MRYIEKHFETPAVEDFIREAQSLHLDEDSLRDTSVYPGWTGNQLYDNKVRYMETLPALKQQMFREQGGVCCYCGMKLEYPVDPQYRLEHVKPKHTHRELVSEYKNLLLSCRANRAEIELRASMPGKARKKLIHCDEAKGAKEITYSPLHKLCETAFTYTLDGAICYADKKAEKDIEILGLDGSYLTNRRKQAIDALFANADLLLEEELVLFKEGLQQRDTSGNFREFYFVLIDAINQLLPTT